MLLFPGVVQQSLFTVHTQYSIKGGPERGDPHKSTAAIVEDDRECQDESFWVVNMPEIAPNCVFRRSPWHPERESEVVLRAGRVQSIEALSTQDREDSDLPNGAPSQENNTDFEIDDCCGFDLDYWAEVTSNCEIDDD
jgi:hypothetical protein